jgi:hypothetical protein
MAETVRQTVGTAVTTFAMRTPACPAPLIAEDIDQLPDATGH